jgi:hypothetical protein
VILLQRIGASGSREIKAFHDPIPTGLVYSAPAGDHRVRNAETLGGVPGSDVNKSFLTPDIHIYCGTIRQ